MGPTDNYVRENGLKRRRVKYQRSDTQRTDALNPKEAIYNKSCLNSIIKKGSEAAKGSLYDSRKSGSARSRLPAKSFGDINSTGGVFGATPHTAKKSSSVFSFGDTRGNGEQSRLFPFGTTAQTARKSSFVSFGDTRGNEEQSRLCPFGTTPHTAKKSSSVFSFGDSGSEVGARRAASGFPTSTGPESPVSREDQGILKTPQSGPQSDPKPPNSGSPLRRGPFRKRDKHVNNGMDKKLYDTNHKETLVLEAFDGGPVEDVHAYQKLGPIGSFLNPCYERGKPITHKGIPFEEIEDYFDGDSTTTEVNFSCILRLFNKSNIYIHNNIVVVAKKILQNNARLMLGLLGVNLDISDTIERASRKYTSVRLIDYAGQEMDLKQTLSCTEFGGAFSMSTTEVFDVNSDPYLYHLLIGLELIIDWLDTFEPKIGHAADNEMRRIDPGLTDERKEEALKLLFDRPILKGEDDFKQLIHEYISVMFQIKAVKSELQKNKSATSMDIAEEYIRIVKPICRQIVCEYGPTNINVITPKRYTAMEFSKSFSIITNLNVRLKLQGKVPDHQLTETLNPNLGIGNVYVIADMKPDHLLLAPLKNSIRFS